MQLEQPTRVAPLGVQVAQSLRLAIVSGSYSPGDRLVEDAVAASLGVSRNPVREALRQLQLEGLVERRGRGFAVLGLSEADVAEIYELRTSLEGLAVRLVAERATDDDLALLGARVDALFDAADHGDEQRFAEMDVAFHSDLCGISRNRRLAAMWEQLAASVVVLVEVQNATAQVRRERDLRASAGDHAGILESLRARDLGRAVAAIEAHLNSSRDLLVRIRGEQHASQRPPSRTEIEAQ